MGSSDRGLKVIGGQLEPVLSKQVMVGWPDKRTGRRRYLGRLCGPDNAKANLTLHIGRDAALEQRVLINIHVPVKLHASTSERPRNMYLIIPAEQLSMSVDIHTARNGSDDARQYMGENHLEVRCGLDAPAFVVMPVPRRKLQKPVTGVPAEILSCLQALSEANSLDLYLTADESVQLCLSDICSKLRREWPKTTTPAIDYRSVYTNGWRAAVNCWSDYPHDTYGSSWNPLVEDAPPRYDDAVLSPLPIGEKADSPESDLESPIVETTSGEIERSLKRKAHEALSDQSDEMQVQDSPFGSELIPTEVFPTQLDAHVREHQLEAINRPQSVGSATEEPARESAGSLERRLRAAAAASTSSGDTTETTSCSIVPNSFLPLSSPPFHPSLSCSVAATTTSYASTCALPDIHPPDDAVPSPPPAPLIASSITALKPDLFHDLVQLIRHTSKLLPNVHDDYLPQLLCLGHFARERDIAAFDGRRDALMRTVIWRCAAATTEATTISSWSDDVEAQVEHVRRWMNEKVCRNADLYVLADLVKLQAAATRAKEAQGMSGEEWERQLFERQKAVCFADALYLFGGRV